MKGLLKKKKPQTKKNHLENVSEEFLQFHKTPGSSLFLHQRVQNWGALKIGLKYFIKKSWILCVLYTLLNNFLNLFTGGKKKSG